MPLENKIIATLVNGSIVMFSISGGSDVDKVGISRVPMSERCFRGPISGIAPEPEPITNSFCVLQLKIDSIMTKHVPLAGVVDTDTFMSMYL